MIKNIRTMSMIKNIRNFNKVLIYQKCVYSGSEWYKLRQPFEPRPVMKDRYMVEDPTGGSNFSRYTNTRVEMVGPSVLLTVQQSYVVFFQDVLPTDTRQR